MLSIKLTAKVASLLVLLLSATIGVAKPLLLLTTLIVKLFGIVFGIVTGTLKTNSPPTGIIVVVETVVSNVVSA